MKDHWQCKDLEPMEEVKVVTNLESWHDKNCFEEDQQKVDDEDDCEEGRIQLFKVKCNLT